MFVAVINFFLLKAMQGLLKYGICIILLVEALISSMLLASLSLQLFLINLWTFYSFTLITHTLFNGKISVKMEFQKIEIGKNSIWEKIKYNLEKY